jgi:hypothetical protein
MERRYYDQKSRSNNPTEAVNELLKLTQRMDGTWIIAANTAWLISLHSGAELGRGAVLFSVLSAIGNADAFMLGNICLRKASQGD